ncbi:putative 20s cyclosome subunit (nuc2 cdc27) [Phaeomoniella chlamydospora]|uniref:Putative 20s cyclosome subunit (Nuc2 cdc27) n=1 Tax=Phaeomoniella chlamydospora TaxID=158046 RepID=A0A0G2ETQ7_PHACM|nr:putative 20s cyclosome subunit (nuc2 cdc27) [Phaeomoniella chlamydospora]
MKRDDSISRMQRRKAVNCWVEALKLNPFMWDAFTGLSDTGIKVQVPNIYKMTPEMISLISGQSRSGSPAMPAADKTVPTNVAPHTQTTNIYTGVQTSDPFLSTTAKTGGSSALWEKLNGSKVSVASANSAVPYDGIDTPSTIDVDDIRLENGENMSEKQWQPPMAPTRKARSAQEIGTDFTSAPPPKMRTGSIRSRTRGKADSEESTVLPDPPQASLGDRKRTISGTVAQASSSHGSAAEPARRSVRILNSSRPTNTSGKLSSLAGSLGLRDGRDIKKARAPTTKNRATTSTVGRVVSGNRKHMPGDVMDVDAKEVRTAPPLPNVNAHVSHHRNSANERMREMEALQYLLDMFCKLATGYSHLSHFQCQEAIQCFNTLPSGQRDTPWVLAQIGKAYYEQASYPDAEKFFIRVKTMAPSRLEDMEVYSTVLWHMKNEVELAYLAHELMEVERLSPQAVCALGNSFSLRREHDQALKCFKRATQLDPKFAYGFTLQGHEHVANEEYDKALDSYRAAINADSRHYNAWYGLGKVYEKMGKYEFAEQHYRSASTINPTNAVLVCCIGMVLEKMKNPKAALLQYSRACVLAPQSALSRFKKARVLMTLQDLKAALVELKILKDIAPDEANVHFLLGRLYKMLRDKGNAIKHFTTALNLDPKAAQYIKDAMESLDEDEEEEEDDEMA